MFMYNNLCDSIHYVAINIVLHQIEHKKMHTGKKIIT